MEKAAKHQKVAEWIRERILNGELRNGARLEPELEISRIFGVSRQTVRQALDTVEHEGLLDRRQGSGTYVSYEPAQPVRELSRTVTILSTFVDGYIFPRILKPMVRTLEKSGYSANIIFTNNHLETERQQLLRLLREQNGNPLVAEPVMSGIPNPNVEYYRQLRAQGIPILFFHSVYPDLDVPSIVMDDEQAGYLATECLIRHGHRDIGGIFKIDDGQGHRRYRGYLRALTEAKLEIREQHVCWIDTQDMKAYSLIRKKLGERLAGCTACVCYNDEVAHALTGLLTEEGIRIPEDLSLTGIDNSELARLNTVPLTSVGHPMERMGEKVAQSILRMIQNPGFDASYEFPVELEERMSVAEYTESDEAVIRDNI